MQLTLDFITVNDNWEAKQGLDKTKLCVRAMSGK